VLKDSQRLQAKGERALGQSLVQPERKGRHLQAVMYINVSFKLRKPMSKGNLPVNI